MVNRKRQTSLVIALPVGERGQGLVEYALILVLVAVVVIAVLIILGPVVGNVFSSVTEALLNPGGTNGPLVNVSAERTGGGSGNDVNVTVTVSRSTTVTATDSQSGHSTSFSCSGTCVGTIAAVGFAAGTVTVTADGDSLTVGYPVKP